MASVYACVADLMLSSRVSETLRSAGHEVTVRAKLPDPSETEGIDLIIGDLEHVDPEGLAALDPPSLGFYSHVDVDTRRKAIDAGVDLVVPRSRMARELPALVDGLI